MTNCTQVSIEFPPLNRRKIEAQFCGGEITSDGGVLLLRQIDRCLGLLESADTVIADPRDPRYIQHPQLSLLRQRVYGLCLGYEDLNDHEQIRIDPAIQSAVERNSELGSAPTLCRLENRADRRTAINLHEVISRSIAAR